MDQRGHRLNAVVEVLVTTATIGQLGEDGQSPTPGKDGHRMT
jgi:hypothetical protein